MSKESYSYVLEKYHDRNYHIHVRASPSLNNVQSFAVVLFYRQADGSHVEVAKIDDSEQHEGQVHIDRYYREEGADQKDFTIDVTTPYEAEEFLLENWKRFADLYEENHRER